MLAFPNSTILVKRHSSEERSLTYHSASRQHRRLAPLENVFDLVIHDRLERSTHKTRLGIEGKRNKEQRELIGLKIVPNIEHRVSRVIGNVRMRGTVPKSQNAMDRPGIAQFQCIGVYSFYGPVFRGLLRYPIKRVFGHLRTNIRGRRTPKCPDHEHNEQEPSQCTPCSAITLLASRIVRLTSMLSRGELITALT